MCVDKTWIWNTKKVLKKLQTNGYWRCLGCKTNLTRQDTIPESPLRFSGVSIGVSDVGCILADSKLKKKQLLVLVVVLRWIFLDGVYTEGEARSFLEVSFCVIFSINAMTSPIYRTKVTMTIHAFHWIFISWTLIHPMVTMTTSTAYNTTTKRTTHGACLINSDSYIPHSTI